MNKKRRKYGNGTKVKNYMQDPATELQAHSINVAKGMHAGAVDPVAQILNMSAGVMSQYGDEFLENLPKKALGGKAGNVPIEVEGDEVAEFPNGQVAEFEGPSHENGGIPVDVPAGTDLFSKRLRKDGKTMAQRKKIRTRKETSIEAQLKKNPTSQVLKNTLKRVQEANAIEEAEDMAFMEAHNNQQKKNTPQEARPEFSGGGTVDFDEKTGVDYNNNIDLNLEDNSLLDAFENISVDGLPSASEALGLAGTLYSGIKPLQNTLKDRASDTPNINPFEGFGDDALKAIDEQKAYIQQREATQLEKDDRRRNALDKKLQGSMTSQATLNAARLASSQLADDNTRAIADQSSKQYQELAKAKAQLENIQDEKQKTGLKMQDDANRQDKGVFSSNLAENQVGLGRSIQEASKNLGKISANEEIRNIINSYSTNLNVDDDGNITDKNGKPLSSEQTKSLQDKAGAAKMSLAAYIIQNPGLKI